MLQKAKLAFSTDMHAKYSEGLTKTRKIFQGLTTDLQSREAERASEILNESKAKYTVSRYESIPLECRLQPTCVLVTNATSLQQLHDPRGEAGANKLKSLCEQMSSLNDCVGVFVTSGDPEQSLKEEMDILQVVPAGKARRIVYLFEQPIEGGNQVVNVIVLGAGDKNTPMKTKVTETTAFQMGFHQIKTNHSVRCDGPKLTNGHLLWSKERDGNLWSKEVLEQILSSIGLFWNNPADHGLHFVEVGPHPELVSALTCRWWGLLPNHSPAKASYLMGVITEIVKEEAPEDANTPDDAVKALVKQVVTELSGDSRVQIRKRVARAVCSVTAGHIRGSYWDHTGSYRYWDHLYRVNIYITYITYITYIGYVLNMY